MLVRMIVTGLLFLIIFATGIVLSKSEQPYSVAVLTLHKLISLGALIFLSVFLYRLDQNVGLGSTLLTLGIIAGFVFVVAIISGGLLSTEKALPIGINRLHQIFSVLTLFSTIAVFYLLHNQH